MIIRSLSRSDHPIRRDPSPRAAADHPGGTESCPARTYLRRRLAGHVQRFKFSDGRPESRSDRGDRRLQCKFLPMFVHWDPVRTLPPGIIMVTTADRAILVPN
eukprot:103443-Hanusia_phi.AAC.1